MVYTVIYFLVSLLWLFLFHSYRKSLTFKSLLGVFGAGMVAAPVAGFASAFLKREFITAKMQYFEVADFALYFFIVGPVEEALKFLAVLLTSLYRQRFTSSIDGMILAASAALGFACLENLLYLQLYGFEFTLPRLLLGNLGHVSYAILWGYALGVVLNENAGFSLLVFAMFVSAMLHGAYNYLLTGIFGLAGPILAMGLSFLLYFVTFRLLFIEKKRNL